MVEVLGTRRVFEGRVLALRVDDVRYPNGNRSTVEIVEHNGGVCVIAQPEPASIVLVKQYRPSIGRELWEVPAGLMNSIGLPNKGLERFVEPYFDDPSRAAALPDLRPLASEAATAKGREALATSARTYRYA